jgi:hypothetical protein
MYAALVDSTTAFGPSRHPWGQANGSATATITTPSFIRIPLHQRRAEETNTAKLDAPLDAVDERTRKADEKATRHLTAIRDVIMRITELRSDAQLSDELESVESAADLTAFLVLLGITNRPSIFLLDNGNFQAVWHDDQTNEQISLQFFGHKLIQYAMFARRPNDLDRIAGRGDFDRVRALLKSHGCGHLIV